MNDLATADQSETTEKTSSKKQETLVIYSYSPVFYWWPVWLTGFVFALVTFLDDGRLVWIERGSDVNQTQQVNSGVVKPESSEAEPSRDADSKNAVTSSGPRLDPNRPQIRISEHKFLGFAFAVVLLFVYLHSNVLWRGFRAYFFLAAGIALVLAVLLVHTMFPAWGVWGWVKYIVYSAPDIYISLDGYLFLSSLIFVVWLFVIFVYNRWTYMEFESGQVRIVEEIGEGESVYDTTNLTFEKQKEDIFRHFILGLGFLRPLGYILPGRLARGLQAMTGTGDLVVSIGGDNGRTIVWPNVLNIDNKLEQITTFIKSRRVVSG